MEKIINRGDWEAMINTLDKIRAGAEKSLTEEDRKVVEEKIAEIREVLGTYTPHGLN